MNGLDILAKSLLDLGQQKLQNEMAKERISFGQLVQDTSLKAKADADAKNATEQNKKMVEAKYNAMKELPEQTRNEYTYNLLGQLIEKQAYQMSPNYSHGGTLAATNGAFSSILTSPEMANLFSRTTTTNDGYTMTSNTVNINPTNMKTMQGNYSKSIGQLALTKAQLDMNRKEEERIKGKQKEELSNKYRAEFFKLYSSVNSQAIKNFNLDGTLKFAEKAFRSNDPQTILKALRNITVALPDVPENSKELETLTAMKNLLIDWANVNNVDVTSTLGSVSKGAKENNAPVKNEELTGNGAVIAQNKGQAEPTNMNIFDKFKSVGTGIMAVFGSDKARAKEVANGIRLLGKNDILTAQKITDSIASNPYKLYQAKDLGSFLDKKDYESIKGSLGDKSGRRQSDIDFTLKYKGQEIVRGIVLTANNIKDTVKRKILEKLEKSIQLNANERYAWQKAVSDFFGKNKINNTHITYAQSRKNKASLSSVIPKQK